MKTDWLCFVVAVAAISIEGEFRLSQSLGLPYSFDTSQLANCTFPRENSNFPSDCSASWATAAVYSLSLRRCYQFNTQVPLSFGFVYSCLPGGLCNSGLTKLAWEYLNRTAIPTQDCVPQNYVESCPSECTTGTPTPLKVFGIRTYHQYRGVVAIQTAIMQAGPVQACFDVYEDFYQNTGVYTHTSGALVSYSCFVLTGWTGAAWNGYNFWGVPSGSFLIQMGQCGVENDVWGGVPMEDSSS